MLFRSDVQLHRLPFALVVNLLQFFEVHLQVLLDDVKPCIFPLKILSVRLYLRVLLSARMLFLLILLEHTGLVGASKRFNPLG